MLDVITTDRGQNYRGVGRDAVTHSASNNTSAVSVAYTQVRSELLVVVTGDLTLLSVSMYAVYRVCFQVLQLDIHGSLRWLPCRGSDDCAPIFRIAASS